MLKNDERAIFRVRYPQLKQLLLRFRGSDKTDQSITSESVRDDLIRVGKIFGMIESNESVRLTNRGREMLLAYENGQAETEKKLLRLTFLQNPQLRLHWALICDRRDSFTTAELSEVFKEMGYADLAETSLRQYIRAFVDWAEVAGLCGKKSFEGHAYTILNRIIIGASESEGRNEAQLAPPIQAVANPENELHLSIFKLNSYICDFLADQSHKGDLNAIKIELEKLRGNAAIDDMLIDVLERAINVALETKSMIGFASVAQTLRDFRNRYIGEGRLS